MDLERCTDLSLVAAADVRGRLRLDQAQFRDPREIEVGQIVGYAECQKAHLELSERQQKAHGALLDVMADPSPENRPVHGGTSYLYHHSWHYKEVEIESGRRVPVAYEVQVNVLNGLLSGEPLSTYLRVPIKVGTHVIHKPTHDYTGSESRYFTGELSGLVVFDADASYAVLRNEDVRVRSFESIRKEVMVSQAEKGRREAVEAWVDEFMALPHRSVKTPQYSNWYGLESGEALQDFFTWGEFSREGAIDLLTRVFNPANARSVYKLLDQSMVGLAEAFQKLGVHEKLDWFVRNVTAIRQAVDEKSRYAVIFGFEEAFKKQLAIEEKKVNEVAELAKALLTETRNINHCAPVTTKPVLPEA